MKLEQPKASVSAQTLRKPLRGGAIVARIHPESGNGAKHRLPLLPDHLSSSVAPAQENGHQHQGDRVFQGTQSA
ncbi:hypothetical protein YQE_07930, partial [Dendroctonus ponderosae]